MFAEKRYVRLFPKYYSLISLYYLSHILPNPRQFFFQRNYTPYTFVYNLPDLKKQFKIHLKCLTINSNSSDPPQLKLCLHCILFTTTIACNIFCFQSWQFSYVSYIRLEQNCARALQ